MSTKSRGVRYLRNARDRGCAACFVGEDSSGQLDPTASMSTARSSMTATPLVGGRVLVVGGAGERTTALYDPPTGMWIPGGTLTEPRGLHQAVRLRDGRVLVAGGARLANCSPKGAAASRSQAPSCTRHR